MRDLPTSLVERALPFITVYSGRPQINVLDAAPEVVAALPGMTQEHLNAFLGQRRVSPENAKTLLPKEAQQYATFDGGKTFRVTVRVVFDNGHTEKCRSGHFVCLKKATNRLPYCPGTMGSRDDRG